MKAKKVLVSGCFDLLHAGHVYFLQQASKYGELYVSLGSDINIHYLKNKWPTYPNQERLFIIQSLSFVKKAFIAKGMGILDFAEELTAIQPDIFIVNEDGDTLEKRKFIEDQKIKYIVLKILSDGSAPPRHTTDIQTASNIPYRIDLAGG